MTRHAVRSARTNVRHYERRADCSGFSSAVSLHAHTHHSREVMADLPAYIAQIPVVAAVFHRELQTYAEREGQDVDFSKGWWHPPVSPRAVFESEAAQIEARFDLMPIVSITDHDDILAGLELQQLYAERRAPISFEWTIPYGSGFFHLGVHNLPSQSALAWFARLSAFTERRSAETVHDLLTDLNRRPDILVVFNHPLWDLAGVGDHVHAEQLAHFLKRHHPLVHALELNGYRSRHENDGVRVLGAEFNMALVSGGDRHTRAPNALLNLTAARTFAEFAAEVRDGVSDIVIMPEYRQHIVARKLAAASDVLRRYRSYPVGRQYWTDRVSCDWRGSVRPLSFHWPDGGPLWVRSSVYAFRVLTSPVVLPVIRVALETVDAAAPAGGQS